MTQVSEDRTAATSWSLIDVRWQPPATLPESRLRRLCAALGLILLTLGVPAALALSIGWPLPQTVPTVNDLQAVLSAPLEWGLVLNALALVVWGAWVHFTLCVVTEIVVAVRGARAGARAGARLLAFRVPFGGFSQDFARRLVQASLVTATLAGSVTLTGAHGTILTPARPAAAAEPTSASQAAWVLPGHPALPGPLPSATAPATPAAGPRATPPSPAYVVQPPHGGYYDSLWDIAERYLGDGQRWREIYQLNEGLAQPGGRALTRPELIRPGWRLLLPRDATGLPEAERAAEPTSVWVPEPLTAPEPSPAAPSLPTDGAATAPTVAASPATSSRPTSPPPPSAKASESPAAAIAAPTSAPTDKAAPAVVPDDDPDDELILPTEAVSGLLAAAGLAALATLRHRQRRRRGDGQKVPQPDAALAQAESRLRVLAEPDDLTQLDTVLRSLTLALPPAGRLPDVRFALMRAGRVHLALAEELPDAPAPFVAQDDGSIWRTPDGELPPLSAAEAGRALPLLPLLLTVGRDAEGLVMLDLEALGSLAVEGPDSEVTAVLTHVVAEAALAPWAEGVEVLVVGFDADLARSLEAIAPDRVTAVDDLEPSMLRALGTRANRVAADGDRLASRVQASGPDAQSEVRPPLLVVCAAPPEEMSEIVAGEVRAGVVVIAPAPWAMARATWVLGDALPVPGPDFAPVPCQLDAERAASLAENLRIGRESVPPESGLEALPADAGEGPSTPGGAEQQPAAEPLVLSTRSDVRTVTGHATDSGSVTDELDDAVAAYLEGTAPASVGFLGPITVRATGNVEPDRRARLTEIVAYLAAHRRGAAVVDFDAAIWPDRPVTLKTRNQAITRARAWLGGDDDGVSWLRPMAEGDLRLSRQVLVDWELFQSLQERASRPGRAQDDVRRDLETAMRLVRGRPLAQLPTGRYAWLAETFLEQEIPSAVIDVAHHLAGILLERGDAQRALEIARLALEVDRYDERPWRDLLEAHHLRGEHRQVVVLVDQLRELLDVELDDDLQPETAELLERLLPRRRQA